MHRKSDSFAREKAAHMEQIRASIGRCLRDKYDTSQPLPKRLADLVRKIKQPASKSKSSSQPARANRSDTIRAPCIRADRISALSTHNTG
jgi:hypothetical protein